MLTRLGCWLLALLAALFPTSAWALETGQCLPAGQVRAALAAENQNPIIVGNRTGYGYPTSFIFFSNASGSKGYLIRGDKPLGQQADTACVDSVYRDVRINDITLPGIPAWARFSVDGDRARAACSRDHLGYQEICLPHDASLANRESNGQHVMFTATGTAINPRDKSIRPSQRLVVTANPASFGGVVSAVTADGADYILTAYSKISYTQNAAAMLEALR